ncbi:MAG TPA: hypothetical protein VJP80_05435 [Candidatus Saccharimonadales bacterium]|nr:hypothetical protein [Candidatus Saccharimonadales bacterium]
MPYEFQPDRAVNPHTGKEADIFRLSSYEHDEVPGELSEVWLGDKQIQLPSHIMKTMARFDELDRELRERNMFDCGSFALACTTGEIPENLDFNPDGSHCLYHSSLPFNPEHDQASLLPGDIVLTLDTDTINDPAMLYHHFMVRVTTADHDGEPLYAAQLGAGGTMALHNFEQGSHLFNGKTAWEVYELYAVPTTDLPQSQ